MRLLFAKFRFLRGLRRGFELAFLHDFCSLLLAFFEFVLLPLFLEHLLCLFLLHPCPERVLLVIGFCCVLKNIIVALLQIRVIYRMNLREAT